MIYQNNNIQRSTLIMLKGGMVVLLITCILIKHGEEFILLFGNLFTTQVVLKLILV